MIYPPSTISSKAHKKHHDKFVASKNHKADARETELKTKANNVTRSEVDGVITIESERFEALYEGNDIKGRVVCPQCGNELCRWCRNLNNAQRDINYPQRGNQT